MNIVLAIIILLGYTIAMCIKGGGVPSNLSVSVFDLLNVVDIYGRVE